MKNLLKISGDPYLALLAYCSTPTPTSWVAVELPFTYHSAWYSETKASRFNHSNQHKQRPNKVKNNDHYVNLSSCILTKEETSILSKGLGFVPTPPTPHPSTIQKDINRFARTLRLKYQFQHNRPKKRRFKPRSNYIPPLSTSKWLEDYIYALKIEATKLKPRKTRNNLSQRQRIALRKLRKRKDIIIKKADKGSTVVIQDRQEYINTGLEHLSDKDTYSELEEDQTKQSSWRSNSDY